MSDIVKKDTPSIDNFAGWEDGVEGDDRPQSAGIIQGSLIKFSNEAMWVTRDGDELSADLELVAVDVARVVQRWQDQEPVETVVLEPHQKFPDIEEMNQKVPRKEWVKGPTGQPRGPWQAQHILYLLDTGPVDKYTFATGTTGGRIAIRELRDKLVWMRRLRGANVYPVITLADKFMNTKYGGRQRPHFVIKRWVRLGGEGGEVEALPPPPPPQTTQQALDEAAKPADKPAQQDLPLVAEPSLAEEMNDEIPDFGNETAEAKASPSLPNARRNLKKQPAKTSAKATGKRRLTNLDAG